MSNYSNNEVQLPGVELLATMTGSWVSIGTLPYNPCKIIFDNLGASSVAISFNNGGATTWKTFAPGEAIILDNDLESFCAGTVIYGNGAAGSPTANQFSVAYTYIKPN